MTKQIRTKNIKKDEIVPITFDYVFTNIFNNEQNIPILESFLSSYFEIPIEKIKGNVKLKNRNLTLKHKRARYKQLDLVLKLNKNIINIELNNNYSEGIKERNIVFICDIHASQLKISDNKYQIINSTVQINLNNVASKKPLKESYYLKNEKGQILSKKIRIDEINLKKGRKMCYTNSETKLARWCMVLTSKNKKEFEKALGDDLMEKNVRDILISEVDKYSIDEESYGIYSNYSREELERNTLIADAKKDGIEIGKKDGIEKGKKDGTKSVAKNMLDEKLDINLISRITGLSLDEVIGLKNN